jgi:hypothetical protein
MNGVHRNDDHIVIVVVAPEFGVDERAGVILGSGVRDHVGQGTRWFL